MEGSGADELEGYEEMVYQSQETEAEFAWIHRMLGLSGVALVYRAGDRWPVLKRGRPPVGWLTRYTRSYRAMYIRYSPPIRSSSEQAVSC